MTTSATRGVQSHATVTVYLIVRGADRAIAFYRDVFGAEEVMRMMDTGGRVGHAELRIGESRVMLADEYPEVGALSPRTIGGAGVRLLLEVPDVDATVQRAVRAGATLLQPVEDKSYGERGGRVEDPFGHVWLIATQMAERGSEAKEQPAPAR